MNLGLFYDCAAIVKSFSTGKAFYGVGQSTPRPAPNLEGQGIPFCLGPVWHGRPYQQLRYRPHSSSRDHMTTQAPPLRRSRGRTKQLPNKIGSYCLSKLSLRLRHILLTQPYGRKALCVTFWFPFCVENNDDDVMICVVVWYQPGCIILRVGNLAD
jgi:hypothetical protein